MQKNKDRKKIKSDRTVGHSRAKKSNTSKYIICFATFLILRYYYKKKKKMLIRNMTVVAPSRASLLPPARANNLAPLSISTSCP